MGHWKMLEWSVNVSTCIAMSCSHGSSQCAAISTPAGDCGDGEVRLQGGATNEQSLTMDGRLEICFNNAWGTVCNNSFRLVDAEVACNQLVGFAREGTEMVHLKTFSFQSCSDLRSSSSCP